MPSQLKQIIIFCARRYNENRDTRNSLGKAHLEIMNRVKKFQLASADPDRDALDFLSKLHSDPDLVKACKEVLERLC